MQDIEYIVKKDGLFHKRTIIDEELGELPHILKKATTSGVQLLPDAFTLNVLSSQDYIKGTADKMMQIPCHVGKCGKIIYVAHRLIYYPILGTFDFCNWLKEDNKEYADEWEHLVADKTLPYIDTHKDVADNPHLEFKARFTGRDTSEGSKERHRAAVHFPGLWMLYSFRATNHRVNSFSKCFITTNIRGKHYAPTLPNIFDNGDLCLGGIRARFKISLQETVQNLFNEFFMSYSNDHLIYAKGWETLYFKLTMDRHCTDINMVWDCPSDLKADPENWHKGRDTTVAAEFFEHLSKIEEES